MKTFRINDNYQVVCRWEKTRYGFRHLASLKDQYYNEIAKSKCCYYNRTWESFEYESVLRQLLNMVDIITEDEKAFLLNKWRKNEIEEVNNTFGLIAGIAKLGEILTDNQKDSNDWKARMLKAGLPGLDIPENWNSLSEDEKAKRLDNVIEHCKKAV